MHIYKNSDFPSFFFCVYTIQLLYWFCFVPLAWQKLHTFKYARYIIISSSGVSGMWSCTRLIMWWNATRCISVLFEIWSRHMSSCVSIWVSFLTKELSRHSLWFSADYWRQKFLQKHHTLYISLSSSMLHSATVLSLLSFFFPFLLRNKSFHHYNVMSIMSNMQECAKISTKVYSSVMLKGYKNSPQNLGHC